MATSPSQKDPFMVIDESERPPLVAYGGRSPSKSPAERARMSREFAKQVGPYVNSSHKGIFDGNVTPRSNQQKVGEQRWDQRHHVSPSQFNTENHIFYKVS